MGIFKTVPTKSALKKAIKKEYITVNGSIATTATFISGGAVIELRIPKKANTKKVFSYPLQVLFEDEYLAAIHKPAGILVSGNNFKTIANALSQNIEVSHLPDATIPQPVHRLDYATTGILLVGKTSGSIRTLNKAFEEKTIRKTYNAVTIGTMPSDGKINLDIDGKEAQSEFTRLQSVPSERFGTLNLVRLKPLTGRRHQLRKHLSSIGNAILGDKTYGVEGKILSGKGMYLHAYSLQFEHPVTKSTILLKAPLPMRFRKIFPTIDF